MLVPMAVISGGLAPVVGKMTGVINPRWIASTGLVLMFVALGWYSLLLSPTVPIWVLLFPAAVLGLASACIWAPISITATRNLPPRVAGAGSGVYNTTRQIGAVLGSASIAVLIQARLTAELPKRAGGSTQDFTVGTGALPSFLHAGFTDAMAQSILLPAIVALLGAVVALFFAKPKVSTAWHGAPGSATEGRQPAPADVPAPAGGTPEHAHHAAPVPVDAPTEAAGHHGSHRAPAHTAEPTSD